MGRDVGKWSGGRVLGRVGGEGRVVNGRKGGTAVGCPEEKEWICLGWRARGGRSRQISWSGGWSGVTCLSPRLSA